MFKYARVSFENITLANEGYALLNATYAKAFRDQEERIKSIHAQTEEKLKELNVELDTDYTTQNFIDCVVSAYRSK